MASAPCSKTLTKTASMKSKVQFPVVKSKNSGKLELHSKILSQKQQQEAGLGVVTKPQQAVEQSHLPFLPVTDILRA